MKPAAQLTYILRLQSMQLLMGHVNTVNEWTEYT